MAAAWREYFSALTSAMSSWTLGRSFICKKRGGREEIQWLQVQGGANTWWQRQTMKEWIRILAIVKMPWHWANLGAKALGLGLDLFGVLEDPLIQNQRLAPLLHQHVGLGDEEAPSRETMGNRIRVAQIILLDLHPYPFHPLPELLFYLLYFLTYCCWIYFLISIVQFLACSCTGNGGKTASCTCIRYIYMWLPVGLVDQSLEGHLFLEGVVFLQTLQGGQLCQTL